MTPLTEAEIAARLPVWVAMSELFLDTYPFDWTLCSITRAIEEAGLTEPDARAIFANEVGPAFAPNLLQVAGGWAMFGEERVRAEVLAQWGKPPDAASRNVIETSLKRDWPIVRTQLAGRRTPGLRRSTFEDGALIRATIVDAFGRGDEADLAARLRAGGHAPIETIAQVNGIVVAHALFSALDYKQGDKDVPALALAPVSVLKREQNKGWGEAVVAYGLDLARRGRTAAVFVLGDPKYYARFGFSADEAKNITSPYAGKHFQALALKPLALSGPGVVRYAPPFGAT